MDTFHLNPWVARSLVEQRQQEIRAQVRRRPRRRWAPVPQPKRREFGITATPRIPQQRPAEPSAYAEEAAHAEPPTTLAS